MRAQAVARHVRVSPRKARLLVDMIRGKRVEEALNMLHFNKKQAAIHVEKTIRSAVANLMNMIETDTPVKPESFIVEEAFVNDGPSMKRWRPRAHGRASQILKRTSHITIRVFHDLQQIDEA